MDKVPDAVLIGGTASALYAGHRDSINHDHVLADLEQRYLEVLDAVEASEGWATSVRASPKSACEAPGFIRGEVKACFAQWFPVQHSRNVRPAWNHRVYDDASL